MTKILDTIVNQPQHPAIGGTLLAAGVVPAWFDSSHLGAVYYVFVIPPAAWYCGSFLYKEVWPTVKRWFTKT